MTFSTSPLKRPFSSFLIMIIALFLGACVGVLWPSFTAILSSGHSGQLVWITAALALLTMTMRKLGMDWGFALMTLGAFFLYYLGTYFIGIANFSHDSPTHIRNVEYIVSTGDWRGLNNPLLKSPFFYSIASLFYQLAVTMDWDVWFTVRHLTLLLYALYIYIAWLTIRLTIRLPLVQKLAFAAIVFWPIGFTFPIRFTPDIAICTTSMAVFYLLLKWQDSAGHMRYLSWALTVSAFSFLLKVNGLTNLVLCFFAISWMLYMRNINIKKLWSVGVFFPLLLQLFFIYITFHTSGSFEERIQYIESDKANVGGLTSGLWFHLLFNLNEYFYYIVYHPNHHFDFTSIWTTLLSSMFTGNFASEPERMYWESRFLLWVISTLGLLLYAYNVSYWCYNVWQTRLKNFFNWLLFFAIAIPCALLLFFQLINSEGQIYANARYMPHFVALFCILFGRALDWQFETGRKKYYASGVTLMLFFILSSLLLFLITCNININLYIAS